MVDPAKFENTLKTILMPDATDEQHTKVQSFNMQDRAET